MATLRDLRYRDDQVITDRSGHEVDLSNLERNFSAMVDPETGEEVTNPNLQRFIDNPELAQFEADLALLKEQPGQDTFDLMAKSTAAATGMKRSGDYENKTALEVDPAGVAQQQKEQGYQQRISDASGRMQQFSQPQEQKPFEPMGMPGEREQFRQQIVNERFGGEDPYTFNPLEAVEALDASYFQKEYDKFLQLSGNYRGEARMWWDLDEKERMSFIKDRRSAALRKFEAIQQINSNMMKEFMGEYDKRVARNQSQQDKDYTRRQAAAKEYAANIEKRDKARKAFLDRRISLTEKLGQAQEMKADRYGGKQQTGEKLEIEVLKALRELEQEEAQFNQGGAPPRPDVQQRGNMGVSPGRRTKQLTPEVAKEYWSLNGGSNLTPGTPQHAAAVRRTLQMLEDAGYDTTPQKYQQQPKVGPQSKAPGGGDAMASIDYTDESGA